MGPASAFPLSISADLRESLEEVLPTLQAENIRCFYLSLSSPTPGVGALGAALEVAPPDPVPANLRAGITPRSPALFIYTSGTTGEGTRPPYPPPLNPHADLTPSLTCASNFTSEPTLL